MQDPLGLRLLALLGLLVLPLAVLAAEGDGWTEVAKQGGVTVWEKGADARPLPLLRAVTTFDATPIEVAAVVQDVSGHPSWIFNCKEARILKEEGEIRYVYNVTDAPWPVSDRYAVVRGRMEKTEGGGLRISFQATDEIEVDGDGVRMTKLVGSWDLRPLDGGRTELVYNLDADPGGMLPSWLVRQTATELPLNTLLNLRARVLATRGQYVEWIEGPGAAFVN